MTTSTAPTLAALVLDHIKATADKAEKAAIFNAAAAIKSQVEEKLRAALDGRSVTVRHGAGALLVFFNEGGDCITRETEFVDAAAAPDTKTEAPTEGEAKRGRGRPPGAPNKPKDAAPVTTPPAATSTPAGASEGAAPATTTPAGAEVQPEAKPETKPAPEAAKAEKAKTYTADEFRALCRKESQRIGSSAPVMEKLGPAGVGGVKAEDYARLAAEIQAIPAIVKA
jgi:hypothetical protein